MLLSWFFQRFKSPPSRRELLRTCISELRIDQTQKDLFLGSMSFLDESGIDHLYNKITSFISELEAADLQEKYRKLHTTLGTKLWQEAGEHEKERNSFKILLDTI